MEASTKIRNEPVSAPAAAPPAALDRQERVLDFSSAVKDKLSLAASEQAGGKRDFSAALDLVNEAFEAIRLAEERAAAAEEHKADLLQRHAEQVRVLEGRLAASEKRAEALEGRAKTAETWLSKFHDTIVDEFQRTFTSK